MKNEIRAKYKKLRSEMSKTDAANKSIAAAGAFLETDIYKNSNVLMLYMPIGNETDTKMIIDKAFEDGKQLVFPVTDTESGEIIPIFANADTEFKKGSFSVLEPQSLEIADKKKIDVVLVPGIAFDKSGNRVGFGKGCYDKFLRGLSAVKVGFCYELQLCRRILADTFDIKIDFLITEKGLISCIKS